MSKETTSKENFTKCSTCKQQFIATAENGGFICSGINSEPTKWSEDKTWLCLKGELAQGRLEMTETEAILIASAICKPRHLKIIKE